MAGEHHIAGINSRLDGMQPDIQSAKLPHLAQWTKARQNAAEVYDTGFNQIEDVVVPEVAPGRGHVYHLYTIRHPRRDALAAHLNANELSTRCRSSPATNAFATAPAVSECVRRSGTYSVAADICGDATKQLQSVIDL
jgi:dTDP-4-amino-4,6-dideoxygalactose transaminase